MFWIEYGGHTVYDRISLFRAATVIVYLKPKNGAMQHCKSPFERLHINSWEDIPFSCSINSLISIYTVCTICNNVANLNPGRLKTWILWLFQGFPQRGILWHQFLCLSNAIGLICNYCTNKPNKHICRISIIWDSSFTNCMPNVQWGFSWWQGNVVEPHEMSREWRGHHTHWCLGFSHCI